ncbi:GlsB/YeaQ/YmgE family stress response membrane protein [Undibacterium sp.]|jgi:uncharacterized membrane protein YeaQ/YmgE (transglycosylase-associated protein family)|uniref:GlsB/YeaQ/YmgE family stress response membrane protein n=1 Tax=Undibacterium sp. TaxID=1914977 RepID=UPI002B941B9C|nr:GlsB/YeaQ/YmgE family stress response membrane protein [Undibacterium sp.]HTD06880.1 GlsB/YeaQ/YmgE family stress response membrane protein [Undibacterium sp.]
MNFIAWILSAGAIAWFAGLLLKSEMQHGMALNLVVGVFGSALGHWILGPFTSNLVSQEHLSSKFELGASSALGTFFGALVLLAILNLIRKGKMR